MDGCDVRVSHGGKAGEAGEAGEASKAIMASTARTLDLSRMSVCS